MLNPFEGLKNSSLIWKGSKNEDGHQSWLNDHAQLFIKSYAIFNFALTSLKQTILTIMYVFITNSDVYSDLCMYGFPRAILKMSAMENDKRPRFGISIIQFLFVTQLQYSTLHVCFWEKLVLFSNSEAKIAVSYGY